MVPASVPGRVQRMLGSDWPGTVCTSTFALAHPAFSNMVCKLRTRWSGLCGNCCRRCCTTDLSRRRKVTLSARQALERAKTTSRLEHRSMRHASRRLRVAHPWPPNSDLNCTIRVVPQTEFPGKQKKDPPRDGSLELRSTAER